MERKLNEILNRAHKAENRELLHNLVNHTSEVADGEYFIKGTERAKEILSEVHNPEVNQYQLELEFRTIIRRLEEWLDTHNWT